MGFEEHRTDGSLTVSNPWQKEIFAHYWAENMMSSKWMKGLQGTVSDRKKSGGGWDWQIEVFCGTAWSTILRMFNVFWNDDFSYFSKLLFDIWLEEYLHMIYRWEGVNNPKFCDDGWEFHFLDEEKPVRAWVSLLGSRKNQHCFNTKLYI